MKKLICMAGGLLLMASAAYAGGACCPWTAKKAADEQAAKTEALLAGCTMECMDTLDLSAEQKEQIQLTKAECDQMECSDSAKKKMSGELAKILKAEQVDKMAAYCKENCASKG